MTLPPIPPLRPHDASYNSHARAFKRALALFHAAAERVPAYKTFLRKARVNPRSIKTEADFSKVPPTDKPSYISRFGLDELSWDGVLSARHVSTSSGSTGEPFFWPRGERQDDVIANMYRHVFDDIFGARKEHTLCIDSFALGTWIAGLELYNAALAAIERGSLLTLSTPGIDKDEALKQLARLHPHFRRILIVSYPPFAADIIRDGIRLGIPWKKLDVRFLVAGEAASEEFKARLLKMAGVPDLLPDRFVNIYGMADSGVVAHETPFSVALRRSLKGHSIPGTPAYEEVTGVYQYYPLARFFESNAGTLFLTSDAGLPLVRYNTKDTGGLLSRERAAELLGREGMAALKKNGGEPGRWKMPLVYLNGRKDFSVTLYGLNVYVEHVKRALERSRASEALSGLFSMSVTETRAFHQRLDIAVELAPGRMPGRLAERLTEDVEKELLRRNSEYAKLYGSIGKRARPRIALLPFGDLKTVRGRKHRWIRR